MSVRKCTHTGMSSGCFTLALACSIGHTSADCSALLLGRAATASAELCTAAASQDAEAGEAAAALGVEAATAF
jgi:hypothetical protein